MLETRRTFMQNSKSTFKNIAIYIGIAVFLVLIFGLGIKTTRVMPDNAVIVVNDTLRIYAPPHCYKETGRVTPNDTYTTIFSEIKGKGYEPDSICRNQGYFHDEPVSILRDILENNGILKPRPSRWKKDGSWNW